MGRAIEEELEQFFSRMGVTGWIGHFLAIAFFGVLVPLRQGLDFLDAIFLLAYACLPCLFASPLVAESVAGRRASPPAQGYLAQLATPVLFACLWNLLILGSGLLVVNLTSRIGHILLPPLPVLLNMVLLSIAVTLFAASATGWLTLNVKSAKDAKRHARRLFLLLLLAVVMWTRMAPSSWKYELESRLTPGGITGALLPVSAILALLSAALIRAGVRRRREEAEGPLLKLDQSRP